MATSRDKINAVLYTGFNALTSHARHHRHNRYSRSRRYTVFGEVVLSMEVADKIVAAARNDCDNPQQVSPITVTAKQ